MTKHICGSCRYFQEARDSKHGWCTHPDRRETSAVRILVRSAELRCRNDWGDDLWQERVDSDRVIDVVMHDSSSKSNPDSSARPIPKPMDLPPVVYPAATVGSRPIDDTEDRTALVSANLNRELLQRAHKQARERQQNRGYSISSEPAQEPAPAPVPAPAPERDAIVISNKYVPPSRQLSPDEQTELPFTFADASSEHKFDELVPRADAPEEPTWVEDAPPARAETPVRTEPARTGQIIGPDRASDQPDAQFDPEPTMRYRPPVEFQYDRPAPRPTRQAEHRFEGVQAAKSHPVDDVFAQDFEDEVGSDEYPVEHQTWPGSGEVGVWAGIVRTCQTCRDFRPAGDGQRGWCNNQWAFKHRRMVDAQDRPCETSIGNWWIPGDDAWQGTIDISALGQPTPLVDKFLGRPIETETSESAPIRRRRLS